MTTMRVQYASNLFLGSLKNPVMAVNPVAPILALLGNIGGAYCPRTKDFFQWAETEFQRIYWIPGALEYSSGAAHLSWRQKADMYYLSIQDWNLKKTVFSQKFQDKIDSVNILATPGWHGTMSKHAAMRLKDWNSDGTLKYMTHQNCFTQQVDELEWIFRKTEKSIEPTVLFTYSPITYNILKGRRILCHLYGTEYEEVHKSASGGENPWVGINMGTASNFRKDAVVEINPKYS